MKAEWEKSSFLDQMQLQIDNGDGFYDGILTGADLRDYRPLATLDPGETRTVDVTLFFPESADNPYQQSSDDIRWCFAHKAGEKRRISCDGKCRTLFTLCSNLLRSSDSRGLVSEKETVR